ncbi:MAG: hypothetical protein ACO3B3_07575 [Cyanobium sp.]
MPWSSDSRPIGDGGPLIELPSAGLAGQTPPVAQRPPGNRPRGRRRRRATARWHQLAVGLGLSAAGGSLLVGLMAIPQRFDGLLLVSKAIADLIGGLSRLGLGLLQLGGVLAVALLAVLALLLLSGGLVRIVRAILGQPLSRAGAPTKNRPAARTTRGR